MPTTTPLDALKAYLGVKPESTAQDELLTDLLAGVTAGVESWLNRSLLSKEYTERYDGNGKPRLILRQWPVTMVSEVIVNEQPVSAATHHAMTGWINLDWRLVLQGRVFDAGTLNVTVRYTAGYDSIPADLQQAIYLICAQRFRERDWTGYQSKTLAGETVSFASLAAPLGQPTTNGGMPPAALATLSNYKRVVPT